jgi:hypothetical protein
MVGAAKEGSRLLVEQLGVQISSKGGEGGSGCGLSRRCWNVVRRWRDLEVTLTQVIQQDTWRFKKNMPDY